MWFCSKCNGTNVRVAKWVNPNTGAVEPRTDVYNVIIDDDTKAVLSHCEDCDEFVLLKVQVSNN